MLKLHVNHSIRCCCCCCSFSSLKSHLPKTENIDKYTLYKYTLLFNVCNELYDGHALFVHAQKERKNIYILLFYTVNWYKILFHLLPYLLPLTKKKNVFSLNFSRMNFSRRQTFSNSGQYQYKNSLNVYCILKFIIVLTKIYWLIFSLFSIQK